MLRRTPVDGRLQKVRCSVAQSLVVALLLLPAFLALAVLPVYAVVYGVYQFLVWKGIPRYDWIFDLCMGVLIGVPLLAAYFACRTVYSHMRWKWVRDPAWRHCLQCGYDLTGNESRICPECGRRLHFQRDDDRSNVGDCDCSEG